MKEGKTQVLNGNSKMKEEKTRYVKKVRTDVGVREGLWKQKDNWRRGRQEAHTNTKNLLYRGREKRNICVQVNA